MAGRSFFRRLLGGRSDAAGFEEVATPPSPAGPIHMPYPNATGDDDPAAVAKSATIEEPPDGTSHAGPAGERVVADSEPTAFDEADAVFGQRTGVPEAKEVAPTQPTPVDGSDDGIAGQGLLSPNNVVADPDDGVHTQTFDDGIVGMNGIISPNNIVADPDDTVEPVIDAGDGVRQDFISMNGIIAPNNVIADPDDTAQTQSSDDSFINMNGIVSPNNIVADPNDTVEPLIDAEPGMRDSVIAMNGIVTMNGVTDGGDAGSEPSIDAEPGLRDGVAEMNGIISPNNIVADPDDTAEPLIDAGTGLRDGIIEMNGIIAPNNVIEDPEDDLVLADLSGGSIRDQLAANTGFSSGAADLELTDDLDDVDDLDVD